MGFFSTSSKPQSKPSPNFRSTPSPGSGSQRQQSPQSGFPSGPQLPPSDDSKLVFGFEMEILVRPNQEFVNSMVPHGWQSDKKLWDGKHHDQETLFRMRDSNRNLLIRSLAQRLNDAGINTSTHIADYKRWSIMPEILDEPMLYYGIELVSKPFKTAENWSREVNIAIRTLMLSCSVFVSPGCAMHVHVSPSSGGVKWQTAEWKSIIKAIIYFDDPITRVMPSRRKENAWAESNVVSEKVAPVVRHGYRNVRDRTWGPIFSSVDKTHQIQAVLINLGWKRNMSFNLHNIMEPCGTIEFRRPPGIQTASAAFHWIGFTLGFIQSARKTDWAAIASQRTYPTVDGLRIFITNGLRQLEQATQSIVNTIEIVEDNSKAEPLTIEQLSDLMYKKLQNSGGGSSFVKKANSRPNSPISSRSRNPSVASSSSRNSSAASSSSRRR